MIGTNRIFIFCLIVFLVNVFFAECQESSIVKRDAPVNCSWNASVTNGAVVLNGRWPSPGGWVNVTCKADHEITGPSRVDCHPYGGTSAIPTCVSVPKVCTSRISVTNGTPKLYGKWPRSGGWAIISCSDGYEISGKARIKCVGGKLSPNVLPRCNKITCDKTIKVTNGVVAFYGLWANISCSDGYEIDGLAKVDCRNSKNVKVKCVPVPKKLCAKVTVSNGNVRYDGKWPYPGGMVTVKCNEGYKMSGLSQMRCNENGRYDAAPVCVMQSGFKKTLPIFIKFEKEISNLSMVKVEVMNAATELKVDNSYVIGAVALGSKNLVRVDFYADGNPYAYFTLLSSLMADPSRLSLSDENTAIEVIEGNQSPSGQATSDGIPEGAIAAIVILSLVLLLSLINFGIIVFKGTDATESRNSKDNSNNTPVTQPKEQLGSAPTYASKTLKLSNDDHTNAMGHTAVQMFTPVQTAKGSKGARNAQMGKWRSSTDRTWEAIIPIDKTQFLSHVDPKKNKGSNQSSAPLTGQPPSNTPGSGVVVTGYEAVKKYPSTIGKVKQGSTLKTQQSNNDHKRSGNAKQASLGQTQHSKEDRRRSSEAKQGSSGKNQQPDEDRRRSSETKQGSIGKTQQSNGNRRRSPASKSRSQTTTKEVTDKEMRSKELQ